MCFHIDEPVKVFPHNFLGEEIKPELPKILPLMTLNTVD